MGKDHGRTIEIETLDEFDELIRHAASHMAGWRLEAVDLRGRTEQLLRLDPAGALLLGCLVSEAAEHHLRRGGALLFPVIPHVPFEPYRSTLYSPEELYAGLAEGRYDDTVDAQAYAWSRQSHPGVEFTVARALHDHAIDEALADVIAERCTVGVMGGHTIERGAPAYLEAARLGRALARGGWYVASGGGPGAMEASNLGAYLVDADDHALGEAVEMLAAVPSFRPSVGVWARAALGVREQWAGGGDSLGIPTWFYGHEPPNVFATHIAKYFQNSLREDTLLRNCPGGIVFLPGAGGTVQEIFQDACENYYADVAVVAPMVLVGVEHWTQAVPAWPLLRSLAAGRPMEQAIHLVDAVDEALACLRR